MIYIIAGLVGTIIGIFIAVALRRAYQMGLAVGRLEASTKHTELAVKQWAERQAQPPDLPEGIIWHDCWGKFERRVKEDL